MKSQEWDDSLYSGSRYLPLVTASKSKSGGLTFSTAEWGLPARPSSSDGGHPIRDPSSYRLHIIDTRRVAPHTQ